MYISCIIRVYARGETLNDRYRSLPISKDEKHIVNGTPREIKLRVQMHSLDREI